jgi:hypothetical protein
MALPPASTYRRDGDKELQMVYDDRVVRKVEQAVSSVVGALRDAGRSRYGSVPLSDLLDTILDGPPGYRNPLPEPEAERVQKAIDKAATLFETLGALRERAYFYSRPPLPVWTEFLNKSRELLDALRSGAKNLPEMEYHFDKWFETDGVQEAMTAFPAELDRLFSEGFDIELT